MANLFGPLTGRSYVGDIDGYADRAGCANGPGRAVAHGDAGPTLMGASPSPTPAPAGAPTPALRFPRRCRALPLPWSNPTRTELTLPAHTSSAVNQNTHAMTIVEDGPVRLLPISGGDPDRWVVHTGMVWQIGTVFGGRSPPTAFPPMTPGTCFRQGDRSSSMTRLILWRLTAAIRIRASRTSVCSPPRGCIRIAPDEAHWLTQWGPYNIPMVLYPMGTGRTRRLMCLTPPRCAEGHVIPSCRSR